MSEPRKPGQPRLPEPVVRATVTLTKSDHAFLLSLHPKLSKAIRKLIATQRAAS